MAKSETVALETGTEWNGFLVRVDLAVTEGGVLMRCWRGRLEEVFLSDLELKQGHGRLRG